MIIASPAAAPMPKLRYFRSVARVINDRMPATGSAGVRFNVYPENIKKPTSPSNAK